MATSSLLSQRLHNQRLSTPEFETPADVVRWFGAVQAQDFQAAKWALGLRMRAATDTSLEMAFNKGQIIRTHVMRPTWHFVTPEDIRWLLQLTAPRVKIRTGPYFRKFDLDDKVLKQTNRILKSALKSEKYLTRATLQKELNKAGVDASDPIRLAHIFLRAELDAVVCSGPRIGKQFTYALFDERVPATRAITHDEALLNLVRKYFASHGPATIQDFTWWSGLTVAEAQHGIRLAAGDLERGASDRWVSRSAADSKPLHSAHLLPAFDEYTVAYKNRKAFLQESTLTEMGLLGPIIIVAGKLAGTWERTNTHKSVTITLRPFAKLNRSQQSAVIMAAKRYGEFLGTPAEVNYAPA